MPLWQQGFPQTLCAKGTISTHHIMILLSSRSSCQRGCYSPTGRRLKWGNDSAVPCRTMRTATTECHCKGWVVRPTISDWLCSHGNLRSHERCTTGTSPSDGPTDGAGRRPADFCHLRVRRRRPFQRRTGRQRPSRSDEVAALPLLSCYWNARLQRSLGGSRHIQNERPTPRPTPTCYFHFWHDINVRPVIPCLGRRCLKWRHFYPDLAVFMILSQKSKISTQ